nr:altronate dehydratase family protein [Allomuricauda sp.]
MPKHLQIDPRDNIVVAITELPKGLHVDVGGQSLELVEAIKAKHKFALQDFNVGDEIYMYGTLVGRAVAPIAKGSAITTENLEHASANYENKNEQFHWDAPNASKFDEAIFFGYHREDGQVGTRNNWLVIPLVFCENRNVDVLEAALSDPLGYLTRKDHVVNIQSLIEHYKNGATEDELYNVELELSPEEVSKKRVFPNVDGIKFLRHDGGCGGIRQDADTLCRLLAGYITHPNTAGATVLSLGCQNAQVDMLQNYIKTLNPNYSRPVFYLEQQQSSSEREFIETAVKKSFIGMSKANGNYRKPAPLNKLVLGLECGGSDGFSGISANPALGHASDLLVAMGGSAVLAEFPELNGVEQELINRCGSEENAQKFIDLMRSYSNAATAVGSGFDSNPSPGNIKDGLITDAMKSAGAAKKGGTSPIVDVLDYTEPVTKPGLNLLCTPGNDVESTTGLAGSGCNMIVFTTGLGTPTGNPLSPVLKMSSNTNLYEKMNDIIDINAGTVISGEHSIEAMGEDILEHIIKLANGEILSKAEINGQNDFIPWKRGISL